MNYWQIQKQDRTLSASHLLIEDTEDLETNLLVNRIHFGKMFALTENSQSKPSLSCHSLSISTCSINVCRPQSLKICTLQWFVTLRSLTLFVTQAVASSVFERHSVCYLAISKINVALQSWSQDKQL